MAVRTVTGVHPRSWDPGKSAARLRALPYAEGGKRDLRLDLLRGLAASMMVVDHIGGETLLTQLSGANQFIVSAAEGFVFLSGLVLGMAYGERIRRSNPREAIRGLLRRAATLYKASVGTALAFLVLFAATDLRLWFDRAGALNGENLETTVVGILTLHRAFHGSDVLVMYTLLIAAAPVAIYLMYIGRTPQLLLGSIALWGAYQRFPVEATVPWAVTDSSFPVAAWQLLFVLGMVAGFYRGRVANWLTSSGALSRATIAAAASAAYLLAHSAKTFSAVVLPDWFGAATYGSLFAKAELGPGRVLAFLAMAVLAFTLVNVLWGPISVLLGWFLLPIGQNSLYVYITHLFLLVLVYNVVPLFSDWAEPDTLNLAAQLFTLGLLWIMVRFQFLFNVVPR